MRMESSLLEQHGHLALLHNVSNDGIVGFVGRLRAAFGTIFSVSNYKLMRKLLRDTRPDVVHVHNFFPLISPSVFYACRAEGVPVVFTLHNFRIICPTALLMYEGGVTERSVTQGPWWAVKHRVYRNSWVGTFLLALMISAHRRVGTWRKKVDRFIVLSEFARRRFESAGLSADRLVVKPNFIDIPKPIECDRSGFLYVGRLSPEKGIDVLLEAARRLVEAAALNSNDIRIAGHGPLAADVAAGRVTPLGLLDREAVTGRMQSSVALVLPSVWYEGFPMVLVEAYANGLPVIASRIGALAELVDDGVTGLLFEPGDAADLADKLAWAGQNPGAMRRMGAAARQRYEDRYTPERNYPRLMSIYRNVVDESGGRNR